MTTDDSTVKNHAVFIWSVADLLRGDYKQSEYGKVVLPLTVFRRFDAVLAPVKAEMLDTYHRVEGKLENFGPMLDALTEVNGLWNTSNYDMVKLLDDPDNLAANLRAYNHAFSPEAKEILERFDFATQITKLRQERAAVSRARQVRRGRPAPEPGEQPGDGLPVRGADPAVLGTVEQDGGRALHTT